MNSSTPHVSLLTLRLLLAAIAIVAANPSVPIYGQPIIPAPDGTNTVVTPDGNRLDITGGQTSGDRANLFHSFTQFNLDSGQTANFISIPEIRNILGRITGGDPSRINGLIQVTGSNANLYLINPAGIVFGSSASLNVPASFIATTANGIGFGNNFFNAIGANNYNILNGVPNALAFTMSQPGSIINSGNLTVGTGQNLALVGGTVVNTGQLTAPAGQIAVLSVPGERTVRLSQPGFLLSLDVTPPLGNQPNQWTLPILSLPQLLTGGSGGNATGVSVNEKGQVVLTGSGIAIPTDAGTTIVTGNVDTSGKTGGTVQVLGDKVGLVSANINASGKNGGGNVLIGGDYRGQGNVPNASRTFVDSTSTISVDSFTVGNGGRAIVWADKTTDFYGSISAKGGSNSGNGGFVEISGKDTLFFAGKVDLTAPNGNLGTLLLDPKDIIIVSSSEAPNDGELTDNQILAGDSPGATFTISEKALESLPDNANIILEATDNITIESLSNGILNLKAITGSIAFKADTDNDGVGSFSMQPGHTIQTKGGGVSISGASLNIGAITVDSSIPLPQGGNINLTATKGGIEIKGQILSRVFVDTADGTGGAINISANGGNIVSTSSIQSRAREFGSATNAGNGGAISITTTNGDITVNQVQTFARVGPSATAVPGKGGNITLKANNGNITVNTEVSSASFNDTSDTTGDGGEINLISSGGSIAINGRLISSSESGKAGQIRLEADNEITVNGSINSTSISGNGGAIALTAKNNITVSELSSFTSGLGNGGNITLISKAGEINAKGDVLAGFITKGNGGTITFEAAGNITTSKILSADTDGAGKGGDIILSSSGGAINIAGAILDADSNSGDGGNITIKAAGNITTGFTHSRTFGSGKSGDITITSGGDINTTAGSLETKSDKGNGGAIALTATSGNITTGSINSTAPGKGGNITLNAGNTITAGNIDSTGAPGSGNISLKGNEIDFFAVRNETTSTIKGRGTIQLEPATPSQNIVINGISDTGNDTLDITQSDLAALVDGFGSIIIGSNSTSGAITLANDITFNDPIILNAFGAGGSISTNSFTITGQDNARIILLADGNITTNDIKNPGFPVSITSTNGNIVANKIDTNLLSSGFGTGGPINITANNGSVTTKDIASFTQATATETIGNAGEININAKNDINTGVLRAFSVNDGNGNAGKGGNISLNSTSGNITVGSLNSYSQVTAFNGSNSLPGSSSQAGDITLAAKNGTINILDNIASFSSTNAAGTAGAGGNVTFTGNVTLNNSALSIDTFGGTSGGNITFNNSVNGSTTNSNSLTLNAGTGNITFNGAVGNTVALNNLIANSTGTTRFDNTVNAATVTTNVGGTTQIKGNVTTTSEAGQIYNDNVEVIGNIVLTSDEINFGGTVAGTGKLTLQPLAKDRAIALGTATDTGAGTFDLTAAEINAFQDGFSSITIGAIDSSANITIPNDVTFQDPVTIQTGQGAIAANANITGKGNASITLSANGNINTRNITAPAGIGITSKSGTIDTSAGTLDASNDRGDGGAIALNASGNITTGNITSSSTAGAGGNITLNSQTGAITSGNLNASGTTKGGTITVQTPIQITTKQINSSASIGNGGNVFLDPEGDIQVDFINAQGGEQGKGGTVDITTEKFFRALGIFTDRNGIESSISTTGRTGGGSIAIRHGGGANTAFIVQRDPNNGNTVDTTNNGTRGNITAGTGSQETVRPGSYFGPFTQGLTQVITTPGSGQTPENPNNPVTPENPNNPVTPNNPNNPVTPNNPNNPVTPNNPNNPVTPNNPNNPVTPNNPSNPSTPNNPNNPVTPGTPNNPNNPVTPGTPNNPDRGNSGDRQIPNETRIATDLEGRTPTRIRANNTNARTRVSFDTTDPWRQNITRALQRGNIEQAVSLIEQLRQQEFVNHFEGNLIEPPNGELSLEQTSEILGLIADSTGKKPAVIYVLASPEQLDLVLVTPNSKPVYVSVPEAKREILLQVAREFRQSITDPNQRDTDSYKASAQQLYQWLIAPLAAELQARGIDAIAFSMDAGLRTLPIAALYDGQKFLVEKYSTSLIPSINLTDTRLGDIKSAQVLAMGASTFKELSPLPAVPVELTAITKQWSGKGFLNEQFTLENLKSQRAATPFGIIHLATHGEFQPGKANNSFIQLWDTQLKLDELRHLGWNKPPVELLVLSACRTAVGDEQAELGFAGLAVASGVKTALASLWYVSDEATLALMTEFYPQLKRVAIKADALREAQIAMLRGQVRLQGGQLQVPGLSSLSLPPELAQVGDKTLTHPFYWAGFTMIGSPW